MWCAGIVKLDSGDRLELLIPRTHANISLDGDSTFLGAIKLAWQWKKALDQTLNEIGCAIIIIHKDNYWHSLDFMNTRAALCCGVFLKMSSFNYFVSRLFTLQWNFIRLAQNWLYSPYWSSSMLQFMIHQSS